MKEKSISGSFIDRVMAKYMDKNGNGRLESSEQVEIDLDGIRHELIVARATATAPDERELALLEGMTVDRYIKGSEYAREHYSYLWPKGVEVPTAEQARVVVDAMHRTSVELRRAVNTSYLDQLGAKTQLIVENISTNFGLLGTTVSAFFSAKSSIAPSDGSPEARQRSRQR